MIIIENAAHASQDERYLIIFCFSPDFPEQAFKGIMKHLLMTLSRYHDNRSRNAVEDIIKTLAETHREKFSKTFVNMMADTAEFQKKVAPW